MKGGLTMAVPNTDTFSFFDVCDELYGAHPSYSNLVQAFYDSDSLRFDPAYGSKTMNPQTLLGFRNYKGTPYSNWYLPNSLLLSAMYNNLHLNGIGNFADYFYWSSEMGSSGEGMYFYMHDGVAYDLIPGGELYVRAARTFLDVSGTYSLGSPGPAGGWIFYIDDLYDGTSYYFECPPGDQATNAIWADAIPICDNLVIYN